MGASPAEGEKTDEKLSKGKEKKPKKHLSEAPIKYDKEEAPASGCCQVANRISCCRDGNAEVTSKPKGTKGLRKLSWVGKWEQHELLTAAAVVGAVAATAVAYSFYKRSH